MGGDFGHIRGALKFVSHQGQDGGGIIVGSNGFVAVRLVLQRDFEVTKNGS